MDLAKVRLQLQGSKKAEIGPSYKVKYKGLLHVVKTIYLEEGIRSLWNGIVAGIHRQIVFAGLRISLYPIIRDRICFNGKEPSLLQRIIAGLLSGGISISIASPTDVVKIRLQSQGQNKIYEGAIDAYRKIFQNEGPKGFYRGLIPNIIRCSIMNSSELATYDHLKHSIVVNYKVDPDLKSLHFLCAIVASFVAVLLASPVDVVKTRVMNVIKYF